MMSSLKKHLCAAGTLIIASSIVIVPTYALFKVYVNGYDSNKIQGQVGLQSYFEEGVGTKEDPFVITRPNHFYNLTRLQSLGVFTNEKYYFELGKVGLKGDTSGNPVVYTGDSADATTTNVLDMTNYSSTFIPIGSTGQPFFSSFNGNNLTINNLTVNGSPEDNGVFGYTASNSNVEQIRFTNLKMLNNGYSNTAIGDLYTTTFGIGLGFHNASGVTDINTTTEFLSPTLTDTDTLDVTYPTTTGYTYNARCANDVLTYNLANKNFAINLAALKENTNFISSTSTIYTRVYFTASKYYNGIIYSRILGSYKIGIVNTITDGVPVITLKAIKDGDSTSPYIHGNNVGYIIGHCDGSCKNAYVYQGTNENNYITSASTALLSETDSGLIGEVGINIDNVITPSEALANSGDTGLINFTNVYDTILGTNTIEAAGFGNNPAYHYYFANGDSENIYYKYLVKKLKPVDATVIESPISSTTDSVHFVGKQLIKDEEKMNRGLGIFKMITDDYALVQEKENESLNRYYVTKRSEAFNSVYYTTAEYYDSNITSTEYGSSPVRGWGYDSTNLQNRIFNFPTLPSYADANTWSPALEKNTNFIMKFDLQSSDALENNYFSNVNNSFIKEYFKYKLIDKNGQSVTPGTKNFGLMIKNVNTETETTSNITSIDSYLSLNANSTGAIPTITLNDSLYATKSVDFSISNKNGANVTVIASSNATAGSYVSVYDKKYSLNTTYNTSANALGKKPSYSMYVPSSTLGKDDFTYFNFESTSGQFTSNTGTFEQNGEKLFAHTFKLPQGDYFIGTPDKSCQIYYIAAQGQEAGNAGDEKIVNFGSDVIANVDFLIYDPNQNTAKTIEECRAYLTYQASFSTSSGTIKTTSTNGIIYINKPANLLKIIIWNDANKNVYFDDVLYVTEFITWEASQ